MEVEKDKIRLDENARVIAGEKTKVVLGEKAKAKGNKIKWCSK